MEFILSLALFIYVFVTGAGCTQYDVIVIGAGTSGSIVTSKLVTKKDLSIALVELGPPLTANVGGNIFTEFSEDLTVFDIPGEADRVSFQDKVSKLMHPGPAGRWARILRGLGGTSNMGNMQYSRAPDDYLDEFFPPGWQADDLKKYYDKHSHQLTTTPSEDGAHYVQDVFRIAESGAENSGLDFLNDTSVSNDVGYGHPTWMVTDNVRRGGPISLYFEGLVDDQGKSERGNLDIFYFSDARTIEFEEGGSTARAKSVIINQFENLNDLNSNTRGQSVTLSLTPKTGIIVMAAGALLTPTILLFSGVSNRDLLDDRDTRNALPEMRINNPNLGYIVDHVGTRIVFNADNADDFAPYYYDDDSQGQDEIIKYVKSRTGPYAQFPDAVYMALQSNSNNASYPDVYVIGHPYGGFEPGTRTADTPFAQNNNFEILVFFRAPRSRGKLSFQDSNMRTIKFPDTQYLSDPDDIEDLAYAVIDAINVFSKADSDFKLGISDLGPCFNCDPDGTFTAVEEYVQADIFANFDPELQISRLVSNSMMGTCPMHSDDSQACVDSRDLKLHGTANIHIVDASILPNVPVAPLATVMAVADKAGDILLQDVAVGTIPPARSLVPIIVSVVVAEAICCALGICFVWWRRKKKKEERKKKGTETTESTEPLLNTDNTGNTGTTDLMLTPTPRSSQVPRDDTDIHGTALSIRQEFMVSESNRLFRMSKRSNEGYLEESGEDSASEIKSEDVTRQQIKIDLPYEPPNVSVAKENLPRIFDELVVRTDKAQPEGLAIPALALHADLSGIEEIGSGEFAVAFKAVWKGAEVVIKINKDRSESNRLEEIQHLLTLTLMKYPNVVPLLSLCQDFEHCGKNKIGIVIPFLEKGDLFQFLRKEETGKLSNRDYINIALGMIRGLQALHDNNIIHGYLHLGNFLVSDKGRVLIADFGLSRRVIDKDPVAEPYYKMMISTRILWRWCAPDALATRRFPKSSDIWMFGVSVWQMFGTTLPFDAVRTPEELMKRKENRLEMPDGAPPILGDLVGRCCQREACSRPTATEIVRMLLDS